MSTMIASKWTPRKRDYENELKDLKKPLTVTSSHPLTGHTTTKSSNVVSSSFVDPLLASSGKVELDPLSQVFVSKNNLDDKPKKNDSIENFEPWPSKKQAILHQYVTTKKISITTAMGDDESNIAVETITTALERAKNRSEQLDAFEGGQQTQTLTQQEYISRINEMNKEMVQAWKADQRVKTLKLAIQASKLLSDINVLEFYPSKFCLVTDLLDTFGKLVYTRLLEKSAPSSGKIPERISPDLVPPATRETTRNWFYKIAIIRELLPRILVEAAILKCYSFLSINEYQSALKRLMKMCCGIGDPLVSAFARCYICRVNIDIDMNYREPIELAFSDMLNSFPHIESKTIQTYYKAQKLSTSQYLSLFSPALDWIVQCLLNKLGDTKMQKVMQQAESHINGTYGGLVLNSFLNAIPARLIRPKSQEYADTIRNYNEEYFPKEILYRSLGLSLLQTCTRENSPDLNLLSSVWKVISKLQEPTAYMSCAEVWIELIAREYTVREVNIMLGDIIKHLKPDRMFENFYSKLHTITMNLITIVDDFGALFGMDKMLPFLDLFQREHIRNELFKSILNTFNKKNLQGTNDPLLISALLHCAKSIHDAIGALTSEEEVREASGMICSFIHHIDYGKNFEEGLKFCVEARGVFASLDSVIATLIHKANSLAVSSHRQSSEVHSATSPSFVRACLAFCYITIPSLENPLTKLQLYTSTAQTAFLCQSLSQGDSLIKTAVILMRDFPNLIEIDGKPVSSEKHLYELINDIISTLVVAPDNPDIGILNLAQGLQKVIVQMKAFDDNNDYRLLLLMNMLCFLSTQVQQSLPYHIQKVDSNDTLYGNESMFLEEIFSRIGNICDKLIDELKKLEESGEKRQSALAMEFFSRIITHGDMNQPKCLKFAKNLWNLAQRGPSVETQKFSIRIMELIEIRSKTDSSMKQLKASLNTGNSNA